MARRLGAVLCLAATAIALAGCGYGFNRPPTAVTLDSATLHAVVGSTETAFSGRYWFQTFVGGERLDTPKRAFSVPAGGQRTVSENLSDLQSHGDPVAVSRVRAAGEKVCVD